MKTSVQETPRETAQKQRRSKSEVRRNDSHGTTWQSTALRLQVTPRRLRPTGVLSLFHFILGGGEGCEHGNGNTSLRRSFLRHSAGEERVIQASTMRRL